MKRGKHISTLQRLIWNAEMYDLDLPVYVDGSNDWILRYTGKAIHIEKAEPRKESKKDMEEQTTIDDFMEVE